MGGVKESPKKIMRNTLGLRKLTNQSVDEQAHPSKDMAAGENMKIKHIIYNCLSSRAAVGITDFVARRIYGGMVPHRGRIIDTNDASITPWVRTLIFWRMYESAELRFVERHLKQNIDVIELGGSIGVVASQVAGSLQSDRKLISVEANPKLIEILTKNISANSAGVEAIVVHGAVAYSTPAVDLVAMSFGDSNLAGWISGNDEKQPVYQVPRVTLSALVSQYGFGRFVLIADIEGAEAGIFANDKECLSHCSMMIIELHETILEGVRFVIPDLIAMVMEMGFTLKECHRDVYVFENAHLSLERDDRAISG
jgi:FkbM family methyltransferase